MHFYHKHQDQDCVEKKGENNGQWNDADCTKEKYYVCAPPSKIMGCIQIAVKILRVENSICIYA